MATTTVRVSMWPDKDIEVDEDEVGWLRTQGLLVEDTTNGSPAETEKPTPALKTRPAKEA